MFVVSVAASNERPVVTASPVAAMFRPQARVSGRSCERLQARADQGVPRQVPLSWFEEHDARLLDVFFTSLVSPRERKP
jgi:hypothetical protein